MKMRKWILAAVATVTAIALAGCGGGTTPIPDNGETGGVWETVFRLSTDEAIQGLTHGEVQFDGGQPGFGDALISRRGETTHITFTAVDGPGDQNNSLLMETEADWGAGIMLRNQDFDFRVGDTIYIRGEILELSGGRVQLNRRVGAEDAIYNLSRTTAGPFTMEHTLTSSDVTELRISALYPGLALEARAIGMKVRIDEIFIEGYRGQPSWEIELDVEDDPHAFAALEEGYAQSVADGLALTVTVANTGNQDTGALNITLGGANASAFVLSAGQLPNIEPGNDATFNVRPAIGLLAANSPFEATVTVAGANDISASFGVSLVVNAAGAGPLAQPVVTITGTTASWAAIENAEVYRVYSGTTFLGNVEAPAVEFNLGPLGLRAFPAGTYHQITVVATSTDPMHLDSEASAPANFAATAPTLEGNEIFTLAHFLGSSVDLSGALVAAGGATAAVDAFGVAHVTRSVGANHSGLALVPGGAWIDRDYFLSITVTGNVIGTPPADATMELQMEWSLLAGTAVTTENQSFTLTVANIEWPTTNVRIMTNSAGDGMAFAIDSIVVTRGAVIPPPAGGEEVWSLSEDADMEPGGVYTGHGNVIADISFLTIDGPFTVTVTQEGYLSVTGRTADHNGVNILMAQLRQVAGVTNDGDQYYRVTVIGSATATSGVIGFLNDAGNPLEGQTSAGFTLSAGNQDFEASFEFPGNSATNMRIRTNWQAGNTDFIITNIVVERLDD